MVTANSGNTPLHSNVHIVLLPKLANPPEMALRYFWHKFSHQAGVYRKTWESFLSNQNSDVRKARPRISKKIFGLGALFLHWRFPPSHCQNARRDPPVNRGSKNPRFSWGLNAGEGGKSDPSMRCKKASYTQGNSLQYCKLICLTPRHAEGRSSRASKSACLHTCSPMQAMRSMEAISRYYLKRVSIFLPEDDVGTPHDLRRLRGKDKSEHNTCRASTGSANRDIKRSTQYMVSHARYLKKHGIDAGPTKISRGGFDKGFGQNNVTLALLASSIKGRAMEFTGRFGTAKRVTFGAASRVRHSFTGNMMTLGQKVHPRGAQKGEASPLHHPPSGKGDPLVHAHKAHISEIHQEDRCLPSQVGSTTQCPLACLNRLVPLRGMRVFHEQNTGYTPPVHGLRITGPLLTQSNIVFKSFSQNIVPISLSGGAA